MGFALDLAPSGEFMSGRYTTLLESRRPFRQKQAMLTDRNGDGLEQGYATPRDLVEALQTSAPGARAQLWEWVREPIARLMEALIAKPQLAHGRERMVLHALHSAETFLRTRPLREFANMNRAAFRGALLL